MSPPERHFVGIVAVADPVKANAPRRRRRCARRGCALVMLTGDRPRRAQAVARAARDRRCRGRDCSPQQNSRAVQRLKREGRVVAMAGDGVNDAPALAASRRRHRHGHRRRRRARQRRRSRWSRATSPASRGRGTSATRPCATSARISCSPFLFNALGDSDGGGRALSGYRIAPQPDDRRGGDEPELAGGGRQRAEAGAGEAVGKKF